MPNGVFMNFQLGIFSKGYNDDTQIHKSFTFDFKLADHHVDYY